MDKPFEQPEKLTRNNMLWAAGAFVLGAAAVAVIENFTERGLDFVSASYGLGATAALVLAGAVVGSMAEKFNETKHEKEEEKAHQPHIQQAVSADKEQAANHAVSAQWLQNLLDDDKHPPGKNLNQR